MTPQERIIAEIKDILARYHEGSDTPGGLEHMGDVWNLFLTWEKLLKEPS